MSNSVRVRRHPPQRLVNNIPCHDLLDPLPRRGPWLLQLLRLCPAATHQRDLRTGGGERAGRRAGRRGRSAVGSRTKRTPRTCTAGGRAHLYEGPAHLGGCLSLLPPVSNGDVCSPLPKVLAHGAERGGFCLAAGAEGGEREEGGGARCHHESSGCRPDDKAAGPGVGTDTTMRVHRGPAGAAHLYTFSGAMNSPSPKNRSLANVATSWPARGGGAAAG